MPTLSYIATNIDELFDQAPEEILTIIASGDIESSTITLAEKYKIPVGDQTALSNLISYILIGAIMPEDVVQGLQDLVGVSSEDAIHIATDLEHSLLEKARISLFKKSGDVKTLEFQGTRSKEDLRKELLDTTKRESGINKDQSSPLQKKTTVLAPGSRSQLLEQLQVLSSIPNDEEIEERLKHIQEQIGAIKKQEEENSLDSKIALKSFMFGEKGRTIADPTVNRATYSVTPTEYNVDPYREISE
jgi:type III secretion system FlhB-like substrate exporter